MSFTKHIPNAITCCNLISGCIAVTCALWGNLEAALAWMVAGAVFDFFDGLSARVLGVSSSIGKELDSLADDVTFGVAPSAMIFYELQVLPIPDYLSGVRDILPYTAFLMAAFSALRLAKFNLDERQTTSFIGLPTPANALFWGSLLVGLGPRIESLSWAVPLIIGLMLLSCWMLVSEIPMFALKFKHWGWRGNEVKYVFAATALFMLLAFSVAGIALVVAWYVLVSLFLMIYERKPAGADK